MEEKERIEMEIDNFILYFTSDDIEREQMRETLKVFMKEVFE